MIDKITAHTLAAHGFRLVDKEGVTTFTIQSIDETTFYLVDEVGTPHYFRFDEAGTDYWILKRPYSHLTKTILHEGKEIVPLIEIAKIAFPDEEWTIESEDLVSCMNFDFGYRYNSFLASGYAWKSVHVKNQEQLFQKLYSLHFINLPEGTYREIE